MAVVLSPWPTSPVAITNATAYLRPLIGGDLTDERIQALGATASARIEDYAPRAPQALKNEAAVRFAGYLAQSDYGAVADESVGPRSVTYTTNHAAMFRNCGAAGLLTRHRRRRAGSIG